MKLNRKWKKKSPNQMIENRTVITNQHLRMKSLMFLNLIIMDHVEMFTYQNQTINVIY